MFDAGPKTRDQGGRRTEQPRCFHFTITWSSLTAQLQLRETTRHDCAKPPQSQALALAARGIPAAAHKPEPEVSGRWEMVVPKMVRTGPKSFASASSFRSPEAADGTGPYSSPPMFANFGAQPILSRAFSVIGRRTRALLAGPAPAAQAPVPALVPLAAANGETLDRRAARELFLSHIAKALHSRPPSASNFAANRRQGS
jgi:hypothetical protein